ncbi:MAG TPA: DUF4349 domain-containing protein [Gaiellaceae bacterium]|nr:DUF4349 domain-containing protein [Gaiellaceae bacterium]
MSQPELLDRLRDARPTAPDELRERVRLIAVQAPAAPRRRLTWRRSLVVLVPVAAAIVAAAILLPQGTKKATSFTPESAAIPRAANAFDKLGSATAGSAQIAAAPSIPAPSGSRLQRYAATLDLLLPTPAAVSTASKRAVAIAASLSGYQQSVDLNAGGKTGYARIVLRIPRGNVSEALRRLSALGRITSENVSTQDLQTQVNAGDQLIARLQRQLTALRAKPQTTQTERQIATLTTRVERLQRNRAAAVRTAHYATISLQLSTPPPATPKAHKPGPLHGLGTAFHWLWIGAVYALALGTPLLALLAAIWFGARAIRRRREDALLRRT